MNAMKEKDKATPAAIHIGETLKQDSTWFISKSIVGKVFAVLNAILKFRIETSDKKSAKVTISAEGGLVATLPVSSGGGSESGFKGEWVSGSYSAFDTVVITGGLSAGYYISLMDNNTDPPYNSVKWKQLANNKIASNWL